MLYWQCICKSVSYTDTLSAYILNIGTYLHTSKGTTLVMCVIILLLLCFIIIGLLLIINPEKTPLNELFHRFWLHENKKQVTFTKPFITQALDKLSVDYTITNNVGIIDLTQCYADNFQTQNQKYVLDFIVQSKLAKYPAEVTDICKQYLSLIAFGKPKCLLEHAVNMLLIKPKSQHK